MRHTTRRTARPFALRTRTRMSAGRSWQARVGHAAVAYTHRSEIDCKAATESPCERGDLAVARVHVKPVRFDSRGVLHVSGGVGVSVLARQIAREREPMVGNLISYITLEEEREVLMKKREAKKANEEQVLRLPPPILPTRPSDHL